MSIRAMLPSNVPGTGAAVAAGGGCRAGRASIRAGDGRCAGDGACDAGGGSRIAGAGPALRPAPGARMPPAVAAGPPARRVAGRDRARRGHRRGDRGRGPAGAGRGGGLRARAEPSGVDRVAAARAAWMTGEATIALWRGSTIPGGWSAFASSARAGCATGSTHSRFEHGPSHEHRPDREGRRLPAHAGGDRDPDDGRARHPGGRPPGRAGDAGGDLGGAALSARSSLSELPAILPGHV